MAMFCCQKRYDRTVFIAFFKEDLIKAIKQIQIDFLRIVFIIEKIRRKKSLAVIEIAVREAGIMFGHVVIIMVDQIKALLSLFDMETLLAF